MMVSAFAVMASHAVLMAIGLVLLKLLWRHDLLEIRLVVVSQVSILLVELKQLGSLLLVEVVALGSPFGLHLHEFLLVELLVEFLVTALLVTLLIAALVTLLTFLLAALSLLFVVLCENCRADHEGSHHCHYHLFHCLTFFF